MPDSSGSPEHVRIGPASRPTGGTKWTCPHTTSPKAEPPKGALGPRAGRRRLGPRTPPSVPRREAPIGASRARNRRYGPRTRPSEARDRPRTASHPRAGPLTMPPNRDTLPPDRGSSLALPGKVPNERPDELHSKPRVGNIATPHRQQLIASTT